MNRNISSECGLHGLVYRDMKPENFLFKSPEDSPLNTTDFGLTDFLRPGKKFTDIVGNAYCVAPKVLKGKLGPASDVWSIDVITYILLCGRRPFLDKIEDCIFKEVLLSQCHRFRALVLLGRFLDMGPWAVDLALSVGIFPYVLKLLQTTTPELRQILVFILTKILALDKGTRSFGSRMRNFADKCSLVSTYIAYNWLRSLRYVD
ncbi:hypothetical protein L1987_20769 [Smallanthus sonchifolius]|uniref:Uncharacterized protein n=1 Tax=Smallanthus sonchifolius TaxID=185202 RepID=A0ACB9IU75_9ASTR|nr:hypothetical protein L1987_20769 [Smallanthus sonchifolius]